MARTKSPGNGNSRSKQVASTRVAIVPQRKKNSSTVDLEAEIRRRAFELYEERGRIPGHEDEDWLAAEREVRARYSRQSA